jgi:hypothetical protein
MTQKYAIQKGRETMKDFTKSDLENSMVVECRNGEKYIVIDDKIISTIGYNCLSNYNEDLTTILSTYKNENITVFKEGHSKYDIMKVYNKVLCIDFNTLQLLWERSEVKEVTMAEVEEKFGCKVKIVKE